MLKFRAKNVVPPGSVYFFVVPETGVPFEGATMRHLLDQIKSHLLANSLAVPPDLADIVEDYICRHVPEGFCYGDAEGRPAVRGVTLPQIKSATVALVASQARVSPGEVSRRVELCGRCPFNDRRMCPSCVGLIRWAQRLVGAKSPRDGWLGVCAVDCVALAAKVHVTNVPKNENYPVECWVHSSEVEV